MCALELCDISLDTMYQQLCAEFPKTSPEAIELALQFLRIASNIHLRQEKLFSKHSLTSGRFSLLMILRYSPSKQLSPSEMAERAQVSRATMTQFIDGLEKDGFIKRVPDPNDRRAMLIRLTPKAETTIKKVLPEHLDALTLKTKTLTRSERDQLFRLMSMCVVQE